MRPEDSPGQRHLPKKPRLLWQDEFDLYFQGGRPANGRPGAEVLVNDQPFCSQVHAISGHLTLADFIASFRHDNPEFAAFPTPQIVAKLETQPAVGEHRDAIIAAADVVMVARGDLGEQLAPELVPSITKEVVAACRRVGKPVIVATQMLQSMVHHPSPTQAEVSDVFNAAADGATGVMLSGESAHGKFVFLVTRMMAKILTEAERFVVRQQTA